MTTPLIPTPTWPSGLASRAAGIGVRMAVLAAAALAGCGGGQDGAITSPASARGGAAIAAAPLATGTTTLHTDSGLPEAEAQRLARPSFHAAPVLLEAPADADVHNPMGSAVQAPHQQSIPAELAHLPTRGLTLQTIESARRQHLQSGTTGEGSIKPLATGAVTTYTPAQIRAAYGLPALPAAGTTLSTSQALSLGAGQTIYIVNAMHNPNVVAELAAFNAKFGLPTCTTKAILPTATLPLAAASSAGCELSVVYATAAGAMTTAAPAYDSGWATEIALDVQWAHATAPMARIVLIEAPDPSLNSLVGAIKLANAMGPGAVSMSFGATEGSWTGSVDSAFGGTNMSYLAATGDNGTEVSWPAVSPKVLAVGGTTLTYSGTGSRTEVAWSGTGGGVSAYTATPSYQTSAVPGMGSPLRRTVGDVAFNADPSSGQYTAVMTPGSSTVNWISAGGTSLSTPQWAGLVAVSNAMRVQLGKTLLGQPHPMLYGQIATVAGTYASTFKDITSGTHGTCGACTAKTGFDQLTGLGTPNAGSLLTSLSGLSLPPVAPVVTAATITGKVGTALSFTASATAQNTVTWSLTGAPSGMAISTAGVVSWATPVAGTYKVTVTAKDSKSGLTGSAVYTVTIAAATAPVVTAATLTAKVATAFSYTLQVKSDYAVTWSMTGAPTGMALSTSGVLTWASPVLGTYTITVTAKDSKTGLTGSAKVGLTVAAAAAPVVTSASATGTAGTPFSATVKVKADNAVTWSMTGAPTGMTISTAGVLAWSAPVAGTYTVTVTAKDSKTGLSGSGKISITIAAASAGPAITWSGMTGVAGQAFNGKLTITAPNATYLSISISGMPWGMMPSLSGSVVTLYWASPVAGTYNLAVSATDQSGRTSTATVPVVINAK